MTICLTPKYSPELKTGIANERCVICERLFGDHSQPEFEECMNEIVKGA
jgi:hypothetical protein